MTNIEAVKELTTVQEQTIAVLKQSSDQLIKTVYASEEALNRYIV